MGVQIIVELTVNEGKGDEFVSLLGELIPETRAFDGCEVCKLYRDQDAPERFAIIETFASREHHGRYFAWRQESGTLDALGALLAGPPVFRYLDDTGV